MDRSELRQKRRSYQAALVAALEQVIAALARRPQVHRAILFGSYAQGRADLRTDLDILVVMDSPQDFVTRTAELYRELACPVDLDLLVYTPQEMEDLRHRGLVRQALESGKVIYERRTG